MSQYPPPRAGSPILPPPTPPPMRLPNAGGAMSQPSSMPPPAALPTITPPPPAPAQTSPSLPVRWLALSGAGLLLMLVLGAGALALGLSRRGLADRVDEKAIVRVVSGTATGTGFFIRPPKGDDSVLVATAFHVVDSGKPVTIERVVRSSDKDSYLEAYPETEIVAFDADSDLAVLRIKNLPSSKVTQLDFADQVAKDEAIISAGFPSSSITSRVGLLKKEGKLLDMAKLPVVDRAYGRLVRENATPGLLVSSDLEPGFSGGPTCDEKGRVVGVNVLKDTKYRGQNGAVSSEVLKELVAKIRPYAPPTEKDVEALLKKIQDQHLLLPVDDRAQVAEHELVAGTELPQLRSLISEIRGMEQDPGEKDIGNGVKASSRALLGILLARLPGKSLETYYASSTQEAVHKCEDTARGIRRFLGELDGVSSEDRESDCARLAMRPLAWDLTAVTLEWGGTPREYSVTKIDEVDPEAKVFRASVRMSGIPSLVPVHVAWEGGALRLKLFDKTGRLFALDGSRNGVARDFEGTWVAKRERRPDAAMPGVEGDSDEKLVVSITGTDSVTVGHQFKATRYAAKAGVLFACNHESSITNAGSQTLTGKLHNGVISGSSTRLDTSGEGCSKCGLCMPQSKLFVMKLNGGRLLLYRSNGLSTPEPVEFVRE